MAKVVINPETNLAEELPDHVAMEGVQSGSYSIPLVDPNGDPVAVPMSEMPSLLQQGYMKPSEEQLTTLLKHAKYDAPGEKAKTFAQEAASSATFGLSKGAQRLAGDSPEEMRERVEYNPKTALAGEVTGIVGSSLTGYGAAPALAKAGARVAAIAPVLSNPILHKAAQSALKNGTEMALMQMGSEVGKALSSDPEQTIGTAVMGIGLAGLGGSIIGGATKGAGEALWSVTKGPRLAASLGSLKDDLMKKAAEGVIPNEAAALGKELWESIPLNKLLTASYKIGKNILPEAYKESILKYVGSDVPFKVTAFRQMMKMIDAAHRGTKALDGASDAIFKGGQVLATHLVPNEKDLKKLEDAVFTFKATPAALVESTDDLSHYLPDQAVISSSLSANALNYLDMKRPNTDKPGVLDPDVIVPKSEQEAYKRTLALTQQPLMAMEHLKDGTLTLSDIETLSMVHPVSYRIMQQKLTEKLIDNMAIAKNIPYKTRLSLSLFLGMPLESSMNPQNIMSNQDAFIGMSQKDNAAPQAANHFKKDFKQTASIESTPGQSREAQKALKARI